MYPAGVPAEAVRRGKEPSGRMRAWGGSARRGSLGGIKVGGAGRKLPWLPAAVPEMARQGPRRGGRTSVLAALPPHLAKPRFPVLVLIPAMPTQVGGGIFT